MVVKIVNSNSACPYLGPLIPRKIVSLKLREYVERDKTLHYNTFANEVDRTREHRSKGTT